MSFINMNEALNEDLSEKMDTLLKCDYLRHVYAIYGSIRWIDAVEDDFFKDGLRHLSSIQIQIIEDAFFDNKTLISISNRLNKTIFETYEEINRIKEILKTYI